MKLWTIRTDDNTGDNLKIFTDEGAADAAALAWCKAHWFHDTPCPDDWQSAYERLGDCQDFMWYEEHVIDINAVLEPIIASAQAQIGDLLTQIYQMKDLFDDADGSIQQAIEEAEAWPAEELTASEKGSAINA